MSEYRRPIQVVVIIAEFGAMLKLRSLWKWILEDRVIDEIGLGPWLGFL